MDENPTDRTLPLLNSQHSSPVKRPLFSPEDFAQIDMHLFTPLGYRIDSSLQLFMAVFCGMALLCAFSIEKWFLLEGDPGGVIAQALYFLAYLSGSYYGLKEAWNSLQARSVDINVLMVTGAFLAAWIGAPAEGGFLLFLFTLSGALERLAGERTTSALRAITKILPTEATLLRNGEAVRVRLREVQVGNRVLVRPGDQVPVDGVVQEGRSLLDEASITGESAARSKGSGDPVYAGTINQDGTLVIESTKPYYDTALARIKKLVVEAQEEKVSAQRIFDRFGRFYTMAALSATLAFGLILWIFAGKTPHESLYRAITLLIVCSPCALILSVPTAALSALARAARAGILIKGGARLEEMAKVRELIFDKTGTLTTGEVKLDRIQPLKGFSENSLIAAACALEQSASHPLARPVMERARELRVEITPASNVRNLPGLGFTGSINGEPAFVGRPGIPLSEIPSTDGTDGKELKAHAENLQAHGCSVAAVHHGSRLGLLAFRDTIRPEAARTVAGLRRAGIQRILLLTGDSREAAQTVTAELGLDRYYAELLPEDKVSTVKDLVTSGIPVAMVGDGVNDAPALKTSTVGIAMGAIGSNIAMEAADVILLKDDIAKLPFLFSLSRTARRTMVVNIGLSAAMILILAAGVIATGIPLSLGIIGHEGSTLLVVANSLRLLLFQGKRRDES